MAKNIIFLAKHVHAEQESNSPAGARMATNSWGAEIINTEELISKSNYQYN